ncbi:PARS2 (predicted) [Pycnogonum litorale]
MKSLNVARTFASYQALYNRATISNIFHATVAPAKLSETKKTDSHSRSHKLLVNNGFIRYSGNTGQYIFLPLGLKVLNKLIKIIDDEMAAIGGQKIVMPTMTSAELWKKSGRWESAQSELFTLTDRHDKEYCLGPVNISYVNYFSICIESFPDYSPLCSKRFTSKFINFSIFYRLRYGTLFIYLYKKAIKERL